MIKESVRRLALTILASTGVLGGLLTGALVGPAQAATATGKVETGGAMLNVRSGAAATTSRLTTLRDGSKVTIECQVVGQKIWGRVRTTKLWDRLPNGSYVSDAYIVRRPGPLPQCPAPVGRAAPEAPVVRPETWVAPVGAAVGSGFRTASRPRHDGVDLPAARNTPIRATAPGTVVTAECNASTDNCNVDGSTSIRGCGWYVEISHADKVVTRYCHMVRRPSVAVGQRVFSGQVIGYVGSSGNSSGPHLHFEVHVGPPPADSTNAVDPVAFMKTKSVTLGPPSRPATTRR